MKVCVVCPHFPPVISGMSTMVGDICSYLFSLGHEVRLVTPRHLGMDDWVGFFSEAAGALGGVGRGVDVVHVHCGCNLRSAGFFLDVVNDLLEARVVLTLHGGCEGYVEGVEECNGVGLSAVTCPSMDMCRELREYVSCPVVFIPNGVDIGLFHPVVESGGSGLGDGVCGEGVVFLFAGRLDPGKGIPFLISAMRRVVDEYPEIRLVLAGGGYLEPVVGWLVEELGVEPWISLASPTMSGLPDLYRAVDVAVLPSTRRECCPRFLIEAMATGLPVIGSRVPGIRGIVENGVTGLTFEPRDAYSLAEVVMRLASDEVGRLKMGRRAVREARLRFSLDGVLKRYLKVYKNPGGF